MIYFFFILFVIYCAIGYKRTAGKMPRFGEGQFLD